MADPTDDDTGGRTPKTPKDDKRRQQILIGVGVVGAILTYLLVRHNSAAAATAPVTSPAVSQPGAGSGVSSGDFMNLQNQVYGLSGGLTMLAAMVGQGATSSPTSISTPTPTSIPGLPLWPSDPAPTTSNPATPYGGTPSAPYGIVQGQIVAPIVTQNPAGQPVNIYPGSAWTGSPADYNAAMGLAPPPTNGGALYGITPGVPLAFMGAYSGPLGHVPDAHDQYVPARPMGS